MRWKPRGSVATKAEMESVHRLSRMLSATAIAEQPRLLPENGSTVGVIGCGLMCAARKAISLPVC